MRTWSRGLPELAVKAAAGIGLLLALAVMAVVLVSTAASGDERAASPTGGEVVLSSGAGSHERSATATKRAELPEAGADDPSRIGIVLGAVVLVGGLGVLAWGARRPVPQPVDLDHLLADEAGPI